MAIPNIVISKINYTKILKDLLIDNDNNIHEKLKQEILKLTEVDDKKIILLGRARSAIYLATKNSINQKKNKIVLMSPFTIPEVIELVMHAGGIPYFIDFYKDSTFFDLDYIKESIKLNPSAIIITHYNLNQKYYSEIYKLCQNNNIDLIEDSAISFAGKVDNIKINSLSDYSLYSFSSFKLINFFYGGALSINSKNVENINNLMQDWDYLKPFNYKNQIYRTILYSTLTNKLFYNLFTINYLKFKGKLKYEDSNLIDNKLKNQKNLVDKSYFSLLPSYGASELYRKIGDYPKEKQSRQKISKQYFDGLKDITSGTSHNIKNLIDTSDNFSYMIMCRDNKHKINLKKILLNKNINVGSQMYPNCSLMNKYSSFKGKTTNVSNLCEKILLLPTHSKLTDDYVNNLIYEIKKNY